jgi:hypothetical protein
MTPSELGEKVLLAELAHLVLGVRLRSDPRGNFWGFAQY